MIASKSASFDALILRERKNPNRWRRDFAAFSVSLKNGAGEKENLLLLGEPGRATYYNCALLGSSLNTVRLVEVAPFAMSLSKGLVDETLRQAQGERGLIEQYWVKSS